jgi:hypothetical protein
MQILSIEFLMIYIPVNTGGLLRDGGGNENLERNG